MKCMNRNKRTIYYALYESKERIVDEYGNESGEYERKYSEPIAIRASVSSVTGNADTLFFGNDLSYDRVVIIERPIVGFDEQAVIWIDTEPDPDKKGSDYDYIVKKISDSINCVSIAVSRVSVNE